jgi:hypothetical protein
MADSDYDSVLRECEAAPLPRGAMGQDPRAVQAAERAGPLDPQVPTLARAVLDGDQVGLDSTG